MEDALKPKGEEIDRDLLDELFYRSDEPEVDDADKELDTPTLIINLNEVNETAAEQAKVITERLSGYYFDQKYIDAHPYIPNKIAQEMDNIRRLLKMLTVNEKAQDALISSITANSGKGSLYQSLTSLQSTTLNIQKQLADMTASIEEIFKEMQADCEQTFQDRDKEATADGSMVVRGSRDFIKELSERARNEKNEEKQAI